MKRIANVRFKCCGYNIDAAIDCDFQLHAYGDNMINKNTVAVEIYNFDEPEWDIHVFFLKDRNDNQGELRHTIVDFDKVKAETRKWVRMMKNK